MQLAPCDIRPRFDLRDDEPGGSDTVAELLVAAGAVVCLADAARASTQDIDALFNPPSVVRGAAARVAASAGLEQNWLNDGVERFMSGQGTFAPFLKPDHLWVMIAQPNFLLAMKCLAMWFGADFHDEEDVRYLLGTCASERMRKRGQQSRSSVRSRDSPRTSGKRSLSCLLAGSSA